MEHIDRNSLRVMHGPSEVAGQNYYSALGLREIGVDAETVVFTSHPFGYPYDKTLGVDKAKRALLPLNVAKLGLFFIRACASYNVFHFHYGHTICEGYDMPFYSALNKKVFFEFHGSDIRDTRFSIGLSGDEYGFETIQTDKDRARIEKICSYATGVVLHDDELISHLPGNHPPVYVVPLRVDPGSFTPVFPKGQEDDTVKVVHAPSKRSGKGTSYVIAAVEELRRSGVDVELILVEGKTQKEALKIYEQADIIVDQLLAGTYGVFAIEGMALGKPVITYITDEMRETFPSSLPILSADPNTIGEVLGNLACNPRQQRELGVKGRRYVETYHDYRNIAWMLKDMYEGNLNPVAGRASFSYVEAIANRVSCSEKA